MDPTYLKNQYKKFLYFTGDWNLVLWEIHIYHKYKAGMSYSILIQFFFTMTKKQMFSIFSPL